MSWKLNTNGIELPNGATYEPKDDENLTDAVFSAMAQAGLTEARLVLTVDGKDVEVADEKDIPVNATNVSGAKLRKPADKPGC